MWVIFVIVIVIPLIIGVVVGISREIEFYRQFKDPNAPTLKQRIVENYKKHPTLFKCGLLTLAACILFLVLLLK